MLDYTTDDARRDHLAHPERAGLSRVRLNDGLGRSDDA